jgi:hypothetical protein
VSSGTPEINKATAARVCVVDTDLDGVGITEELFTLVALTRDNMVARSPYLLDIGERLLVEMQIDGEKYRRQATVVKTSKDTQSFLIEFELKATATVAAAK